MDKVKLSFEKDGTYGLFSWPQRNYKCSFCKKEFKSAQALGGHMNIHRRDRAKMRLSSSFDCLNSNPTFPFPSEPKFLSSPSSSSTATTDVAKNLNKRALLEVKELPAFLTKTNHESSRFLKKKEIVRLDLNMGMFRDRKDDLDLELRLGHS